MSHDNMSSDHTTISYHHSTPCPNMSPNMSHHFIPYRAKVEAALAGHLSPDKIGDDLIHAVDGHVKALALRRADAKRQALHSNKPPLQPSRRQQVFAVAPLTREECCKVNADLVTEMADADAFVVADPADPPKSCGF